MYLGFGQAILCDSATCNLPLFTFILGNLALFISLRFPVTKSCTSHVPVSQSSLLDCDSSDDYSTDCHSTYRSFPCPDPNSKSNSSLAPGCPAFFLSRIGHFSTTVLFFIAMLVNRPHSSNLHLVIYLTERSISACQWLYPY